MRLDLIKRFIASSAQLVICVFTLPAMLIASLVFRGARKANQRPRLFWGCDPIINIKYWSNALALDYESKSCVYSVYAINSERDYDVILYPRIPDILGEYRFFLSFIYAVKSFDIFHISFNGGVLAHSKLASFEPFLFKLANKKTIIWPYGSDAYSYRFVRDMSLQHALQISYPYAARERKKIETRVERWVKHADIVLGGIMSPDGIGRWDLLTPSYLAIDTQNWCRRAHWSESDGVSGTVRIAHSPNHRGVKGSEFIQDAINQLQAEGLNIEFILIENVPNSEVRKILSEETDILVEQLMIPIHGMSAVEGMALGLPVVGNLENKEYSDYLRRFSFLNECPIVSATPESICETLRSLVKRPRLREQLGRASRLYVEKYHSYNSSRFMFESIYKKIWYGEDVDLINLYHPLLGKHLNNSEPIRHPLIESRLPENDL